MRLGRYCIRLSRVLTRAASWPKVPVLGERPTGARKVPAAAEPRIEHIQHWSAELAQFHGSQPGKDRAPDVTLIGIPRREVELGDLHVAGQQLDHRDTGIRPLPGRGLLQQTAKHDPGLLLGPHGLPEPQPAAGNRISARMHLDAERPTRQLL
jgi:hypothetical protein